MMLVKNSNAQNSNSLKKRKFSSGCPLKPLASSISFRYC